jgi:hypothetical protein
MGSVENKSILNKKGEILPTSAIEELKASIECEVVVKGEATEDVYRKAIHRFNEAFILEAVSSKIRGSKVTELICSLRASSSSSRTKRR